MRRHSATVAALLVLLFLSPPSGVPLALASPAHDDQGGENGEHPYRAQHLEQTRFSEPEDLAPLAATPCVDGTAAGYPCSNVDLMAFLPLGSIGGGSGSDLWGWTDSLTGREYALMGRTSGTAFVDITDPANPIYLGNLPTHSSNSTWREIKAYANYAFIVSEASNHGMQIFDLTQLRNVTNPPVTFAETAHYDGFSSCHDIVVNEDTGFVYGAGSNTCSGGLHMVNVQNPTAPVFAGCVSQDGYVHDAQCVVYQGPDVTYQGHEICFNSNEDTLTIVDVTNKAAPAQLSRTGYPGSGYTHQGWLTEDHRYFLLDDELDEETFGHNTRTRVFDVANLGAPSLVGFHDATTAAIDHNLFIVGNYAFEANYRAGLRILDLTNVATADLTEVGFFDIYPTSDSASFNGAWGNYPFFPSGTVIVSGIEQGLFVLRPVLVPDFVLATAPATLEICDPGSAETTATLTARFGYTGTVTLEALGLPAGAAATFSVNPVSVPGTSVVTVATSGVGAGTYAITVRGSDGALEHDQNATLIVAGSPPATPGLVSPSDGATEQPRQPLFAWDAVPDTQEYLLEIATDPAFATVVYGFTTTGTSHTVATALSWATLYYWRVTASNPCGPTVSSPRSFETAAYPPILLVDDDDTSPNIQGTYAAALDALGQRYDVWDTAGSDNEPNGTILAPYETVLWVTGDSRASGAGPSAATEAALSTWLDTSRCLLLSGQDYLAVRGVTSFATSHLGLASFTNNARYTSVTGQAGSIFAGLGPYTLSFPYTNRADTLTPDGSATVAFTSSLGNAGILKDGGYYRTSLWGFGLEALPTTTDEQTVLDRFLGWCGTLSTADGDGDGVANGSDCVPSDPALWAPPSEAQDLLLAGGAATSLGWSPPSSPGATSVLYDVLRSDTLSTFLAATCLESDGSDTAASDSGVPPGGAVWGYLVRVENGCGTNMGFDSDGNAHVGPACP